MNTAGPMPPRLLLELAASVGRVLRPAHAERLGNAMTSYGGPHGTEHLAQLVPAVAFTQQAKRLLDAWASYPEITGSVLGAAVAAASHAHDDARRNPSLELVVSGPSSTFFYARRTEQVLLQVIEEAQHDILLVTFALHMYDDLRTALAKAAVRGVRLTVLAEDHQDNRASPATPAQHSPTLAHDGSAGQQTNDRVSAWPCTRRSSSWTATSPWSPARTSPSGPPETTSKPAYWSAAATSPNA
ncbi:MAG TPA: hypothetical protein VK453_29275 [Micromonosporaceae bacterium]|nr:hypothetical protein [Micromonosporaceae bacterium]